MTRLLTAALATAAVLASPPGPAWAGSWLPMVSTGAGGGVVAPVIAMNARGDTIAAWAGGGNLRSAFRPAGAAAFEPAQVIAGGTATNPEIALDPQGNAVVIWTDNTNLSAAVRPAGGVWQGTQLLSTAAQATTSAREVGIDSNGNATAVYFDAGSVVARARTAGGDFATATFGAPSTLDASAGTASNLDLAVHPGGSAVAAWQRAQTATFVAAAVRPAAGAAFGAAETLTNSGAGPNATSPAVAIDAAGNALAVYNQLNGAVANVAWARRPAGGAWAPGPAGAPQYLEPAGTTVAAGPQLAMDSAGNAVAAWQVTSGPPARVRASVLPAGGTPGAAATLSDPASAGSSPVVAAGGGSPMVAYLQAVGANMRVDSRLWTGSDWTAPQAASLSDAAIGSLGAAVDDEGNAAAIWEPTVPEDAVSAIYDAAAPTFTLGDPSPATAAVGGPFTFSVTGATDRFSAVQPATWEFGDGTTGEGATVQHAYGSSGAFAPRVTVRDAAGNSRTASTSVTVTAAQQPPPPPPPLPPPVLAKLVNAVPISGTVRVRLPRTRRFVPLAVARQIPMGSIVDARRGRVRISGTDGRKVFSADFYEGMFRLAQRNRRGAPVDIHLFGGSFRGCPGAPKAQLSARSKTRSVRHLWGNGSGRFRTVGRFSSATLRGTTWLTDDRCNGTRTRVRAGAVNVRDFARRRTIVLRAQRSYFARPLTRR